MTDHPSHKDQGQPDDAAERVATEVQAAILNALPANIALLDQDGRIVTVNEAWRQFGHSNNLRWDDSAVGHNYLKVCQDAAKAGSANAREVADGIQRVLRGELAQFNLEYPCDSPVEPMWFRLVVTPLQAGRHGGAVVMHINITERKLTEARIQRLNRLYAVSSGINEAIVRIHNTQELYERACLIAVERGGLLMAWVGLAAPGEEILKPVAHWGVDEGYLDLIQVTTTLDQFSGRGPGGQAYRTGQPACCNDLEADTDTFASKAEALQRGYRSCASFPLKIEGLTIGVLTVYGDQAAYFGQEEIQLLNALAENLSFAIESHERDRQRLQAENALRASEANMSAAQRIAHFGSWELDLTLRDDINANPLRWSDEMYRIAGFEPGTVKVTNELFFQLVPVEDHEPIRQAVAEAVARQQQYSIVHRLIRPDGQERIVHETAQLFFDERSGALTRMIGTAHDITEQRSAELEIRRTSELLKAVAQGTSDAVFVKDLQGRYLLCNQAAANFVGRSVEEVLGRDDTAIFNLEDARLVMESDRSVIAANEASTSEEILTAAGVTRTYLATKAPYRDGQGNVIGLIGISHDVTDRKRAEIALQESEASHRHTATQLSNVLHFSLDVICSFDSEGRFVQVNPACEAIWGYTPEELLGTHSIDKVLPEDRAKSLQMAAEIRSGHATRGFENRYRRKDGRIAHIQWTGHWSAAEQIMFCVARDVTEARLNAERIAHQASLLDKARDAILVFDLDYRILSWNRSAERLYGWAGEEAASQPINTLLYREASAFLSALETTLSQGAWVGEMEQWTKSGEMMIVEGHWTLVHNDQGDPKSILAINTDITERKQLELQYLRAQRMESIGTLAGGIAHDLNNVLTPIMMSIELLKAQEKDPRRLSVLSTIESSSLRGAEMVRQVLTFARGVEGQRFEIEVRDLLGEVQHIAQETFPHNIDIRCDAQKNLWPVRGDSTQLHQVLLNLCINARDAMPEGGFLILSATNHQLGTQDASLNMDAKAGPHVVIQVEDTGIGMSQQVLERIFEPFFTTKEMGKGTGLGLSTTQAIVRSHGGFVGVHSEEGKGTRFRIYLPAAIDSDENTLPAPASTLPRGDGQLILVVDDEAAVRDITRQTLESFGYRVLLAAEGSEALRLYTVQQQQISAVLTDMMMPIMDGPATIQELRRINPKLPIIAASGLNANGMAARASSLGVVDFIPKPYTAKTLLCTLADLLAKPN